MQTGETLWLHFTNLVLAGTSVFDSVNWCHTAVRVSLIGNFSE